MAYKIADLYSTRHEAAIEALKSADFPTTKPWDEVVREARKLVAPQGFDVDNYKACTALRKAVDSAARKDTKPAASMLSAAGVIALPSSGNKSIPLSVTSRVAVLELVRHLWLLKKSGSHKLWVLSLPESYRDWPATDLAGKDYDGISSRLNDASTHFSLDDRKHLAQASQEGLSWLHKAQVVVADPKHKKHMPLLRRWFADANSTNEDMVAAAATLASGLKKIVTTIKSGDLLVTDMPLDRGNEARANVNAFVFSDEKIDVIYVEPAFFSNAGMFKDLKNWTRIVVHELSHREAKTKDHRYRHHSAGLKPDAGTATFTAAKALDNADSWALFCMDCAGRMVDADYANVKVDKPA